MPARARTGVVGEFTSPEAMLAALRQLRRSGYTRLDTFTPYPLIEVEEILEVPRSGIPHWAFFFGLGGALFAYLVQWWTSAVDYPLVIGGRPFNSIPAWIPICFETAILCGSLGAFVLFLIRARLTDLWSPLFEIPGFEGAQVDRFWIVLGSDDAEYQVDRATNDFRLLGANRIVVVQP